MTVIRAVIRAGFLRTVDSFVTGFTMAHSFKAETVVRTGVRTGQILARRTCESIFTEAYPFVTVAYIITIV